MKGSRSALGPWSQDGWLIDTKMPPPDTWSPTSGGIPVLKRVVCGEPQMPDLCGLDFIKGQIPLSEFSYRP